MVTLAPYDLLSQSFDPIEPRGQTFRFDVELTINYNGHTQKQFQHQEQP